MRDNVLHMILQKVDIDITLNDGFSEVGGGAYPTDRLKTRVLELKVSKVSALERYLRLSKYHIIGKVHDETYIMDIRTIFEKDYADIANAMKEFVSEQ